MNRKSIETKDKEHWPELKSKDISSTEVAALFGLSPYLTKFELWHRKKNGSILSIDENERMKWGTRLEPAIAEGIGVDNGWDVAPFKNYMTIPELRLGSSFDYVIGNNESLLEIKNVDNLIFKDGWEIDEDGNIEAPPHIELQVQHQMLVSGINKCKIGALVGGNKLSLIEREIDKDITEKILNECGKFWKSIDDNTAPEPNFEKDAEFIMHLYNYAEPNKVMDSNEEIQKLAKEYREWAQKAKDAGIKKDALKAQLLKNIGDSEKCKGDNFTISAGIVSEAEINYKRKAYRSFRIHWKKEKDSVENK